MGGTLAAEFINKRILLDLGGHVSTSDCHAAVSGLHASLGAPTCRPIALRGASDGIGDIAGPTGADLSATSRGSSAAGVPITLLRVRCIVSPPLPVPLSCAISFLPKHGVTLRQAARDGAKGAEGWHAQRAGGWRGEGALTATR